MSTDQPLIRIALPSKGHLYDGSLALFKNAGYSIQRASDRQYEATIKGHPGFHVVFMRPADIAQQVREGRCQLGVTGMDVYAESLVDSDPSCVVTPDLGFGGCRLTVAVPESWIDVSHMLDLVDLTTEFKTTGATFRVSTKYPNLARAYFHKWGIYYYKVVASEGALELHPSLGIADIIVDLTSSGATLKDNRLKEIDQGTVLDSAACLIGHADSLRARLREPRGPIEVFFDALDAVRLAQGVLHLEVVGDDDATGGGGEAVMEALASLGAKHLACGAATSAEHKSGWRVTGTLPQRNFAECRRLIKELGARRVIGSPSSLLFEIDDRSTVDELRQSLQC